MIRNTGYGIRDRCPSCARTSRIPASCIELARHKPGNYAIALGLDNRPVCGNSDILFTGT